MLKIVIVASILSVAHGTQYGYINNNLVEFDDPISLPYPYIEPKLLKVEQRPIGLQNSVMGVVPAAVQTQEIIQSPINLLCSLISSVLGCLKRSIMYVITSIPSLIFSFFGICNLTSVCNYANLQSFLTGPGLSSFVTTDRLKRAAEFVETAIKKYRSLQN